VKYLNNIMMAKRILITDEMHPVFIEGMLALGYEVDYYSMIDNEEVLCIIPDYDALALSTKICVTKEMIDKATRLRFIARIGSGLDNIDIKYAAQKGIRVFNSPEGNCNAVAEHTLALILNMLNHVARSDREIRSGQWVREANRGKELNGMTIGIIGYGHVGKTLAKRLMGFDCKVLAYDKYLHNFSQNNVVEVSINKIQEQADIITMHTPLTHETLHWINAHFFEKCKKNIYFVNASRGKVVNTRDLLYHLDTGKIIAAALDVLENEKIDSLTADEKIIFNQLCQRDNITLTPHIAGWTQESKIALSQVLLNKIKAMQ